MQTHQLRSTQSTHRWVRAAGVFVWGKVVGRCLPGLWAAQYAAAVHANPTAHPPGSPKLAQPPIPCTHLPLPASPPAPCMLLQYSLNGGVVVQVTRVFSSDAGACDLVERWMYHHDRGCCLTTIISGLPVVSSTKNEGKDNN